MGSIWYYYLYQSVLRHICLFLLFFQTFWVLYAYSIIWISFIFLFHFYFSFWFSIIPEFVASVIAIYLSWSPLACSSFLCTVLFPHCFIRFFSCFIVLCGGSFACRSCFSSFLWCLLSSASGCERCSRFLSSYLLLFKFYFILCWA